MEDNDVVRALGALAQTHRLQCFRALVVAGPEGLTPGDLTGRLAIAPATLSFHLKALTQAGLISPTRDGRSLVYRANVVQMNALLAFLTDNCCQGQPCGIDSPTNPCKC